jgi:hypothetical protein
MLMRYMKKAFRFAGFRRSRVDRGIGWWAYVGSFGEDFFSDDD